MSSFIPEMEIIMHVRDNVILLNLRGGGAGSLFNTRIPVYYTHYSSWIRFSY